MSSVTLFCRGCIRIRFGLASRANHRISVDLAPFEPMNLARYFSAKKAFEPGKPRTLLELYENNPSWLSKQRNSKQNSALQSGLEIVKGERAYDEETSVIGPRTTVPFPVILAESRSWGNNSRRTGVVGVKLGMTTLWTKTGKRIAVTMVQIKECEIVNVHVSHMDGGADRSTYIEVGAVHQKDLSKVTEGSFAMYLEHGVDPKKFLKPFKVTADALLPTGTKLYATHFGIGQLLKVTSISQTKGFQGVMKRWGMKGQPASHGVSKTHRKMGATGGGQDPGRVFPGKKMAGHMGGNRVCLPSMKLLRINTVHNVLYLKGDVPGHVGQWVKIADSEAQKDKTGLPFPTYLPDEEEQLPEDIYHETVQPFSDGSLVFNEEDS